MNTARSLSRQTLYFLGPASTQGSPEKGEARAELTEASRTQIYRLIAYVHALRLHLREEKDMGELAPFLSAEDLARVKEHQNVPNGITLLLSEGYVAATRRGALSEYRAVELERGVSELTNIQGGCERIKSTPMPFSYSVLMHRIVAIYVFGLPFGLVTSIGEFTPLVVAFTAYAFLGLDAIGDELENPFGTDPNDLPLAGLSRSIEIVLKEMLDEAEVPAPLEPVDRVLL